MVAETSIEWTRSEDGTPGKVWNPVTGCSKVSQGCKNCYAERIAERFWGERAFTDVQCHPERLDQPLRWRKPCRVFVNSMSDLFHEAVPVEFIDQVFAVMAACPQHIFQVLTKRPQRMLDYLRDTSIKTLGVWWTTIFECLERPEPPMPKTWPLRNVQLLVSVEDQETADERIPPLLLSPAAVRGISAEPLLGHVDLRKIRIGNSWIKGGFAHDWRVNCLRPQTIFPEDGHVHLTGIDWVICGGESGPGARPMHPDWARSLRDQCQAAGVPFFFKQWGEWLPHNQDGNPELKSGQHLNCSDAPVRVGKKAAGRLLDGREWSEYPEARNGK